MSTLQQLVKTIKRTVKFHKSKKKALRGCPQKKAICLKILKVTPRKPNSALRRVSWIIIPSTKKKIFAYIPGEGENPLKTHSKVLIRGGTVKDLPGMKYTIIRGQRKFDLPALELRRSSRSKYGADKLSEPTPIHKLRIVPPWIRPRLKRTKFW